MGDNSTLRSLGYCESLHTIARSRLGHTPALKRAKLVILPSLLAKATGRHLGSRASLNTLKRHPQDTVSFAWLQCALFRGPLGCAAHPRQHHQRRPNTQVFLAPAMALMELLGEWQVVNDVETLQELISTTAEAGIAAGSAAGQSAAWRNETLPAPRLLFPAQLGMQCPRSSFPWCMPLTCTIQSPHLFSRAQP